MVPWDHAELRGGERGLPHRSRRRAQCLTDEGEKRLVVERLREKNANAPPSSAAARIAGVSLPVITITFVSGGTTLDALGISSLAYFNITTDLPQAAQIPHVRFEPAH